MELELPEFPLQGTSIDKINFLLKVLNLNDDPNRIKLKTMSGGITNTVYLLVTPSKKAVVRVFGRNTDKIIDRDEEQQNIKKVNQINVYATLSNGLICSYLDGRPIDVPMMADPVISDQVAKSLGQMHRVNYHEIGHYNIIFDRIQNFIDKIDPDYINNGEKIDLDDLQRKFENIRNNLEVELSTSPILLCHNDLLSGNILWDGSKIGFVDYEYSGYTWAEFDLANHFNEWCGFELDLYRFPKEEQQKRFIKIYLKNLIQEEPDFELIEQWYQKINLILPLSHLFWGCWSYFQAVNSSVQFPYFEYAKWRIALIDIQLPLPEGHHLLNGQLVLNN